MVRFDLIVEVCTPDYCVNGWCQLTSGDRRRCHCPVRYSGHRCQSKLL